MRPIAGVIILVVLAQDRVSGQSCPSTIYSNDFNDDSLGAYTLPDLATDWNDPDWNDGVDEGRVTIVDGAQAYEGKSLCIRYPKGKFGPSDSGAQWKLILGDHDSPDRYDELYCSYRVRFGTDDSFHFVKGGKLPGLAGGAANTGGSQPNGCDGWSARMMWRESGSVTQYVYLPGQPPGTFGEYLPWNVNGEHSFVPGQWHLIQHRIVMNTPGVADGSIQGWFDGELALDEQRVLFRNHDSALAIDVFYYSTFFGGGDPSWAPPEDEFIFFDDFTITALSCPNNPGDMNGDDIVNVHDLLKVISQWGACPSPPTCCSADIDGNNHVNVNDLLRVIQNWG